LPTNTLEDLSVKRYWRRVFVG